MMGHSSSPLAVASPGFPVSAGLLLLLALLVVGLHAINLTADVPDGFAADDIGLRVDEGYKTLAPRNLVVFGRTKLSEADQYEGWFSGSPLTQTLMYAAFSVAEPSVPVARAAALIYFFLVALLVLWASRGLLPLLPTLLVTALLAVEPFLFFFSRVALFEVALAVFLCFAFLLVSRVSSGRAWLPLIIVLGCAVAAFFLVKVSALLYFMPAIGVLAAYGLWKSSPRLAMILLPLAVLVVVGLLMATEQIWTRRLDTPGAVTVFQRTLANPLTMLSPWIAGLAWFCLGDRLRRSGRALLDEPYFLAIGATVVGVPLLLALLSYAPPRYFAAVLPVCILVIADWLSRYFAGAGESRAGWPYQVISLGFFIGAWFILLWAAANAVLPLTPIPQGETPGISAPTAFRLILPLALLASLLTQALFVGTPRLDRVASVAGVYLVALAAVAAGTWQASAVWTSPVYDSQQVRGALQQAVSPQAVLIGDWAPFFALGTRLPAIYSSSGWNNGKVVLALCPDYFVYSGTRHDETVMERFATEAGVTISNGTPLGHYAGQRVELRRLHYPDGECD